MTSTISYSGGTITPSLIVFDVQGKITRIGNQVI